MKTYEMIGLVTLHSGIVKLTDKQAKGRAHKLEPVDGKKGLYRLIGPNQFKAGQVIGYDGEIPKVHAHLAEDAAKSEGKKSRAGGNKHVPSLDEFREAFGKLDPGNEDHRTKDGLPDVKALESVGGLKVTSKQRDKLWSELVKVLEAEEAADAEAKAKADAEAGSGSE